MRYVVYLVAVLCVSCAASGSYAHFFRAVHGNDAEAIRALVARGFDPNTPDAKGQPALLRALDAEASDSALALAKLPQTDVNVQNAAGETPLMIAALKGDIAVCKVLIERGAEVNRRGWTPLHYAAAGNSMAALQLLLAHGAKVNARAPNGRTPLMMAVQSADESLVEVLLAAGADLHARQRGKATAAELAAGAGRENLARQLAERAEAMPPRR